MLSVPGPVRLSTGRTAPDAGYSLFARPVWPVFSGDFLTRHRIHRSESGAQLLVLVRFADLSAHESGEHPGEHRTRPVLRVQWGCVFAELSVHVTGEYQTHPVLTWSRPVVRR